jgi:hypothetical protein
VADEIKVKVGFDVNSAPLIELQRQLNGFMRTLQAGATLNFGASAGNWLLQLPSQLKAISTEATEYARNISTAAEASRMSAGAYQVLKAAASDAGFEIAKLPAVVTAMASAADSAVNGNQQMAQAFAGLGINAEKFSALSVPLQLEALAQALDKSGHSTAALNDISEILGKKMAATIIPLLDRMAGGWKKVSDEAVRSGQVASDAMIAAEKKIADQNDALATKWHVTWVGLNSEPSNLISTFDKLSGSIADIIQGLTRLGALKSWSTEAVAVGSLAVGPAAIGAGLYLQPKRRATGGVDPGAGGGAAAIQTGDTPDVWEQKMQADIEAAIAGKDSQSQVESESAGSYIADDIQAMVEGRDSQSDVNAKNLEYEKQMNEDITEAMQQQSVVLESSTIPLQEKLREIEEDRSKAAEDRGLTQEQKESQIATLSQDYRQTAEQILAIEQQRLKIATDPQEIAQLQAEIMRLQHELKNGPDKSKEEPPPTKLQNDITGFKNLGSASAHYQSAGDGLLGGAAQTLTKIGTLGDQINQKFQSIASTISGSISTNLTAVTMRTEGWRTALLKIGEAIEESIVSSIISMAVTWVEQQLMMAIFGRTLAATQVAANAPIAAAETLLWTPAATMATIASWGAAAIAAPAEMAGAVAMAMGLAGASEGGVFDGDPNEIRGFFHGGEGILTARTMSLPGMAAVVHSLNAGNTLGALASLHDTATNGPRSLHGLSRARTVVDAARGHALAIHVGDDRSTLMRSLRTAVGRRTLVDIARSQRGQIFRA